MCEVYIPDLLLELQKIYEAEFSKLQNKKNTNIFCQLILFISKYAKTLTFANRCT
jgi:hypothetical protein